VYVRGEWRPQRERRVQQEPLERPQRPLADQLVTPDHETAASLETHVRGCGVRVADELDLSGFADTEPALVAHPEVRDRERVEAHDLRGYRVDRDLIRRGQDQVAHARTHRARPGTVDHDGADDDG